MSDSHPPGIGDEVVIDLGSTSAPQSEAPSQTDRTAVPPAGGLLRYLIAVVASSVITLAATLLVTGEAFSDVTEPPGNVEELRAAVFADLVAEAGDREVELFSIRSYESASTVLEAGRYQVMIKCGQLSRFHDSPQEFRIEIAVEGYRHDSLLPCPSQVLWLEHRFEFDELSPFMVNSNTPIEGGGYLVGVAVFAVTEEP